MENYRIITDATCDLPAKLVEELELTVIPMECHFGEETFLFEPGEKEITSARCYERLRAGEIATTTQINLFTYATAFEPILKSGQDIIYIAFSSALTGSQQSAKNAALELLVKYPERRVTVIDSRCESLGEGLFVYTALQKQKEGLGFDDMVTWLEENKLHFIHWFTVDDLDFLRRGGRVSRAAAAFGSMLRIKPVLFSDDNGALIPLDKVQGRRNALKGLVNHMAETVVPDKNDVIFIGHGDCLEDAEYVKSLVEQRFGYTKFVINYIGPIIGAHSGPGTVALFYYGSHR